MVEYLLHSGGELSKPPSHENVFIENRSNRLIDGLLRQSVVIADPAVPDRLSLAPPRAFAKDPANEVSMQSSDRADEAQTRVRLDGMRIEHRDLDDAIAALGLAAIPDQLQMARLKRRKLRLRDEIASLEDLLIPDIIA
jgi:hypothetical protein